MYLQSIFKDRIVHGRGFGRLCHCPIDSNGGRRWWEVEQLNFSNLYPALMSRPVLASVLLLRVALILRNGLSSPPFWLLFEKIAGITGQGFTIRDVRRTLGGLLFLGLSNIVGVYPVGTWFIFLSFCSFRCVV